MENYKVKFAMQNWVSAPMVVTMVGTALAPKGLDANLL